MILGSIHKPHQPVRNITILCRTILALPGMAQTNDLGVTRSTKAPVVTMLQMAATALSVIEIGDNGNIIRELPVQHNGTAPQLLAQAR